MLSDDRQSWVDNPRPLIRNILLAALLATPLAHFGYVLWLHIIGARLTLLDWFLGPFVLGYTQVLLIVNLATAVMHTAVMRRLAVQAQSLIVLTSIALSVTLPVAFIFVLLFALGGGIVHGTGRWVPAMPPIIGWLIYGWVTGYLTFRGRRIPD